jgi:hypothetical protein
MVENEAASSSEVKRLFGTLVKELRESKFRLAYGSDGFSAPYIQVLNMPERRNSVPGVTTSNRTTIRICTYDEYLQYLENTFPRLIDQLTAACLRERPFIVIEGWIRYIELGKILLSFARTHTLNVRCVDYGQCDSRLNAVRLHFDEGAQQWRIATGPVEDLLRDPRRRGRSWSARWNPRWVLGRKTARLGLARENEGQGRTRGEGVAEEVPAGS